MRLLNIGSTVLVDESTEGKFSVVGIEGIQYDPEIPNDLSLLGYIDELENRHDVESSADIEAIYAEINSLNAASISSSKANAYADQILYGFRPTKPEMLNEISDVYQSAKKLSDQYQNVIEVAQGIVTRQELFLKTKNWVDVCRLTYTDLALEIEGISETTVRRIVHSIRVKIGKFMVDADALMCNSGIPELCGHLTHLTKQYPKAGAPKLHMLLQEKGINVSQRNIGNALTFLRRLEHAGRDKKSTL